MNSATADPSGTAARDWDGSRAANERARRAATLSASPAQRLAWLEQAMRLAHRSGALERTRAARADRREVARDR